MKTKGSLPAACGLVCTRWTVWARQAALTGCVVGMGWLTSPAKAEGAPAGTAPTARLEILKPLEPVAVDYGEPARMEVVVDAEPAPVYEWYYRETVTGPLRRLEGATNSYIEFSYVTLANAGFYSVVIMNDAGATNFYDQPLTVSQPRPPVITNQPANQVAGVGTDLVLAVGATGTKPLFFQWLKDGAPLARGMSPELPLTQVAATDTGGYSVLVSNYWGVVQSSSAVLTVVTMPTIVSLPTDTTASPGSSLTWAVSTEGIRPLYYQWLKDGVPIEGATNSTLELPNIGSEDAGIYRVEVWNAVGRAQSDPIILTLLDVQMYAGLTVSGPVSSQYQIQFREGVGPHADVWTTITNLTLTTNRMLWIDPNSSTKARRFYRAIRIE